MFTVNELRMIATACHCSAVVSRQNGHEGQALNFAEVASKATALADAAEAARTPQVHRPAPSSEGGQPSAVRIEGDYGTCWKCGCPKTCELFKGVYCPRCRDWC